MEHIKDLLQRYLAHQISFEDFSNEYLSLWKRISEKTYELFREKPEIHISIKELFNKYRQDQISIKEFNEQWGQITQSFESTIVIPHSEINDIIDHLFVECDAVRPQDEYFQPGLNITENEFREVAKQSFDALLSTPRTMPSSKFMSLPKKH